MNEDKATRYHRLQRRVTVLWVLIWFFGLFALVQGGASRFIRDVVTSWTGSGPSAPGTVGLYALTLVLVFQAARLPLALYQGFVLERRYGLSTETLWAWLRHYLKAAFLVMLFAVGAAEVIYLTMTWWPRVWWIASAACFGVVLLLLTRLTPSLLLPLFYRFEPLERDALRERLIALSRRAGIPVLGAFVWALGAGSRRANAALVGAGSTRRILLSDTLLADFSDDEIEVILAHEIAHHVHHDIGAGLLLEFALMAVGLGAGAAILDEQWAALGLASPSDVAGLPVLFLVGALVTLASTPALNAVSRRNEHRADRYAIGLTRQTDAFISAMRRLGAKNLAEHRPSRTALWLFHTHPPIEERIENVKRYGGSGP